MIIGYLDRKGYRNRNPLHQQGSRLMYKTIILP